MQIGQQVTVIKCDEQGHPVVQYSGTIIELAETFVCLKAIFERSDVDIGMMVFHRGDTMIEWYYSDHFYNVFQVEDVGDNRIKGWYCNITRPAQFGSSTISADDLVLDVFVSPSGEITLLDRDEFAALDITPQEREQAWQAVNTICNLVERRQPPFDLITS